MPRAIIEVRNLRKEYPVEDETVVALDRVNLSIPQGQICCIFGESGSGKSTLLHGPFFLRSSPLADAR